MLFSCPAPEGPRSLARTSSPLQSASVPELPDLAVVTEAFHAALSGRPVIRASAPAPLSVRGTPTELAGFVGQTLGRVARQGKFVTFEFDRDRIAVNAMLTGRF